MASVFLYALVVLLCVGHVLGIQFSYQANITGSSGASGKGWGYRQVQVNAFQTNRFLGANYVSINISKSNHSVTEDAIAGACYVYPQFAPFAFVGYFEAETSWNKQAGTDDTFAVSTNFSAAAGYVGHSYQRLVETDANGTVVSNQSLRHALVSSAALGLTWSLSDNTKSNADLKYITLTGKIAATNTTISISFIASSKIGVLNQAETIVGPKSIETVLEIVNWPYQSPNNTLSLVVGVGMGQANYTNSSTIILPANATEQTYFSLSPKVWIGAKPQKANVSIAPDFVTNIENPNFAAALIAKYGAAATYSVVTVTFPPGASDIVYDPSIGAGTPVSDATVDSSSTPETSSSEDNGGTASSTTSADNKKSPASRAQAGLAVLLVVLAACFM